MCGTRAWPAAQSQENICAGKLLSLTSGRWATNVCRSDNNEAQLNGCLTFARVPWLLLEMVRDSNPAKCAQRGYAWLLSTMFASDTSLCSHQLTQSG